MSKAKLIFLSFAISMTLGAQETVLHVTQADAIKAAVAKPQPDYPAMARQLKLQGRVEVEVSISPSGTVEEAKILTGNPALTGAASNAVRRWKFEPFTSDGKPVRATAIIAFNFKL
jgi:protein TonB